MSKQTPKAPDLEQEPGGGPERSWLDADVDGRPVRFWIVVAVVIAAVTLGFGAWWTYGLDQGGDTATGMQDGTAAGFGMLVAEQAVQEADDADR